MVTPDVLAGVLGPVQVILGMSLLLKPKYWHKLAEKISKDAILLMPAMIANLVIGLLILQVYNEFTNGIWLLITITGWLMVMKGGLFILLPESYTKKWIEASRNAEIIKLAGAVTAIMGTLLSTHALLAF